MSTITRRPFNAAGFSLLELIIVIVILGVLATMSAQLIRQPVDMTLDVQRRAQLADQADQALSRMARDLRLSLPNSVRVSADGRSVEFFQAVSGARYRAAQTGAGTGDTLNFDAPDNSFDVLGGLQATPVAGQWVVVYNLTASGPQANAYVGDNRATVGAGSTATNIVLNPAFRFPFSSPAQRMYLLDTVVTYQCRADGSLIRYWGYVPQVAMSVPPVGGSSALVVDGITDCRFRFDPGAGSRHGLIDIRLAIRVGTESVSLQKSAHIPNQP